MLAGTRRRRHARPREEALSGASVRRAVSAKDLVQDLADQQLASLANALLVVGGGGGDDHPHCNASVVAVLWVAREGPDLDAQPSAGGSTATADLGDEVLVPGFDQAGVLMVEVEDRQELLDQRLVVRVDILGLLDP